MRLCEDTRETGGEKNNAGVPAPPATCSSRANHGVPVLQDLQGIMGRRYQMGQGLGGGGGLGGRTTRATRPITSLLFSPLSRIGGGSHCPGYFYSVLSRHDSTR